MKNFLLLILLSFSALYSFSKETDGLFPERIQTLVKEIDSLQERQLYQQSKPKVEELSELSGTMKDNYLQALSTYYQGCNSLWENDFSDASRHLDTSRTIAESLPDNEKNLILKTKIQIALGAYYFKTRQLPQAYKSYQQGLEFNKSLGKASFQYTIESNLLVLYNQLGLAEEIIQTGKEMLVNPAYAKYNKYLIYYMLARCYYEKKAYEIAEPYFDTAAQQSQSTVNSAWVSLYRGNIDNNMERYHDALAHFDEGFLFLSEENNSELEANLLINKGLSFAELHQYDSALFLLDKGIDKAMTGDFFYIQSNGLRYKRDILYRQAQFAEYAEVSRQLEAVDDTLEATKDLSRLQQLELEHQFNTVREQMKQAQIVKDLQHQRQRLILYLVIILLVFAVLTVALLLRQKKVELKNKQLREEAIARELDLRNRELTAKALVQAQRQEILTDIIEKLSAVQNDKKKMTDNLQSIINDFKQYRNAQTPEDFDYYFTQTHPDFYKKLSRDFPNLTPYETHLCAYLRLNLSTKEIAAICGIEPSSVKTARYRLRKSLGLNDTDADLTLFLSKY